MLLTSSQYRRILDKISPGKKVKIGAIPSHKYSGELAWLEHMNLYSHGEHTVEKIGVLDKPVMSDGRILYDIYFIVRHATEGIKHSFALEWIDDEILNEILDVAPLKIK